MGISPDRHGADSTLTRWVLSQLVTRTQIASRYGVKVNTVMSWTYRYPDFPRPVLGEHSHNPYWWWPELRAWCRENGLPRAPH